MLIQGTTQHLPIADNSIDMIFTDPPYNVDYGSNKHHPAWRVRAIVNDKQGGGAWVQFVSDIGSSIKEYVTGDVYIWCASGPEGMKLTLTMEELGLHWSATIIWKKQQLVLSPANYQRMYEPCLYGWFKKSSFNGIRTETEVWEVDRPHRSAEHPTMKPIALCLKGLENSSRPGDIVLDLFLGSGSTLIAAHQSNRVCYGAEIDPTYCDVIVQRYVNLTKSRNIRLNGAEIEWVDILK